MKFHHRIEKLCTAINSSTKIFSGSKLQTAAPLCRFSILLHMTEKAILQRTRRAQATEPSAGPLFSSLWLNKSKLQIHLQVLNLLRRTEKGPHCRGLEKVQTAKPSASLLFPSVKLEKTQTASFEGTHHLSFG